MSDERHIWRDDLNEVKDLIKEESSKTRDDIKGLTMKVDAEARTNAAQEVQIQANKVNIETHSKRLFAVILAVIGAVIAMFFDFFTSGSAQ